MTEDPPRTPTSMSMTIDDVAIEHVGDEAGADGGTIRAFRAVEKAPRRPGLGPLVAEFRLPAEWVEAVAPALRVRDRYRAAIESAVVRAMNAVAGEQAS